MIRICSNFFWFCLVPLSVLLFLTCLTFYVKPVKLISPLKPFFNYWITAEQGFPSPFSRGRKAGLYECIFVKFHLTALWQMKDTLGLVLDSTIYSARSWPYLWSATQLGSNAQSCNLSLCQRPTSCCQHGLNDEILKWSWLNPQGV